MLLLGAVHVNRRDLHVVIDIARHLSLEHKLRLGYARSARVLPLEALVLGSSLWLSSGDGASLNSLRIDQGQLLLVGQCVS